MYKMSSNFENDNNNNSVNNNIHNNNNKDNNVIQSPTQHNSQPYLLLFDPNQHHHESMLNNSNTKLSSKTDGNNDVNNIIEEIEMQATIRHSTTNIDQNLTIRFDNNSMTYDQYIKTEHSYFKHIQDHLKDSDSMIEKLKKDKHKDKKLKSIGELIKKSKNQKKRKFFRNNSDGNLLANNPLKMMADNKSSDYLNSIKEEMECYESTDNVDTSNSSSTKKFNQSNLNENELGQQELGGRSQRIRKKPKRWDNDEVEVDFSGTLKIISMEDDKAKKDCKENEITLRKGKNLSHKDSGVNSFNNSSIGINNKKSISSDENEKEDENANAKNEDEDHDKDDDDDDDNNDNDDEEDKEKEKEKEGERKKEDRGENEEKKDDGGENKKEEEEKIYCICREVFGDRFMIQCDFCETWYHGECLRLTKQQGRIIEQNNQIWYCPWCVNGMEKGLEGAELIEYSRVKMAEAQEKWMKRRKLKEERKREQEERVRKLNSELINKPAESPTKKEFKRKTRSSSKVQQRAQHSKEEEDKQKLIKLVKKKTKMFKIKSKDHPTPALHSGHQTNVEQSLEIDKETTSPPTYEIEDPSSSSSRNINQTSIMEEFSQTDKKPNKHKCFNNDANSLISKKKHKSDPIDRSAQDLFKAEPVLVRSLSSSSASSLSVTSPTLSAGKQQHNHHKQKQRESSVVIESRRTSSSSNSGYFTKDITCPNGCGKLMAKIGDRTNIHSIYCNSDCITSYVEDMLRNLHSLKSLNAKLDPSQMHKPIRIELIDRINNLTKNDITEEDVLGFILSNPTYDIRHPKALQKLGFVRPHHPSSNHKMVSSTPNPQSPQDKHHSQHNKPHSPSTPVKSPGKIERSPSFSDGSYDNRRKFVRNSINEILNSRKNDFGYAHMSSAEIEKLADKIEDELYKLFKNTNLKYNNRSRSLIFNLKDPKNTELCQKVLNGTLIPERLVNMDAGQLASRELAEWRVRREQSMIQLITNTAVDQANQVIVKKTHKGEELIENDGTGAFTEIPTALPAADLDSMAHGLSKDDGNSWSSNSMQMETDSIQDSISMAIGTVTSNLESTNDPGTVYAIDTTAQHIKHVFSKNCKICAKAKEERKSLEHDGNVPSSASRSFSTVSSHTPISPTRAINTKETPDSAQRPQPKRVRAEPESTNKFLEQIEKQQPTPTDGDSSLARRMETPQANSSNEYVGSKYRERKSSESNDDNRKSSVHPHLNSKPIWRGTISFKNLDKIGVNAHKIFGEKTNYISKYPEQIVVCGKLSRYQVLDYVRSINKNQLGLVKFVWSSPEERAGYDAFFNYLHSNKLYGVIKEPKIFKDFYIIPLSQRSDIPKIFLPYNQDDSVFGKKYHRPNLLLGILVKSLTKDNSSSSSSISKTLPHSPCKRSYTPPLLSANAAISPDNDDSNDDDGGSYTPPPPTVFAQKSTTPTKDKSSSKHDLSTISISYAENRDSAEQMASSTNPYSIGAILHRNNPESKQKPNYLHNDRANISSFTPTMSPPAAGFSSASFSHVFDHIHRINIPDNLKDILKNVGTNQQPNEHAKMVATGNQPPFSTTFPSAVERDDNANIVAYNDPRLRTKINQPDLVGSASQQPVAASMSQDELFRLAHEQMAALAEMEQTSAQEKAMLKEKKPIIVLGVPNDGHKKSNISSGKKNPKNNYADDDDEIVDFRYQRRRRYAEHLGGSGGDQSTLDRKISFHWKKRK